MALAMRAMSSHSERERSGAASTTERLTIRHHLIRYSKNDGSGGHLWRGKLLAKEGSMTRLFCPFGQGNLTFFGCQVIARRDI